MEISKNIADGGCTLALQGRLDTMTAPCLHPELTAALDEHKNVTLDLEQLAYISSAGLRVLLASEKKAKAVGGKMTLTNVVPDVMDVFALTGFSDILTFEQ